VLLLLGHDALKTAASPGAVVDRPAIQSTDLFARGPGYATELRSHGPTISRSADADCAVDLGIVTGQRGGVSALLSLAPGDAGQTSPVVRAPAHRALFHSLDPAVRCRALLQVYRI
jgi:hypothetical protein